MSAISVIMKTMSVIARTVPRCTRNRARHWPCSSHTKKGWPRLLGASPESPDVGIAIRYLSFSVSIMGTAASQSIFQPIDTRTVSPVAGAVANSV